MKIHPILLTGVIIDEKETRKTGIGLIFIGVISLIISLFTMADIIETSTKLYSVIFLIIFGLILVLLGGILRKGYFR